MSHSQAHCWSLHRAAGEVRTQKLSGVAQAGVSRREPAGVSRWELTLWKRRETSISRRERLVHKLKPQPFLSILSVTYAGVHTSI